MAYVPPNKRPGFVAQPQAARTHMTSGEVRHMFEVRGWAPGSGGQLYFNGQNTTAHPHLHLQVASGPNAMLPMLGRDVRLAVVMLAWSDGRQGQGGGGRNFISNGEVVPGWENRRGQCNMNAGMLAELNWIMDYFTTG